MKIIKTIALGLLAPCLIFTGASAQGLLGERYFGVDGGWERLENDGSDDGWGVGAEINAPFTMVDPGAAFGADLNIRGDYRDVLDRDIFEVDGVLRAYVPPGEIGFTPFVGAGFGYVDFDLVDTTYIPVEAGLAFAMGPVSLLPYFRYSFALDSAVNDFWTVGATGVIWVDEIWGLTASVDYRDYDDIGGLEGVDTGWTARVGLVFSY